MISHLHDIAGYMGIGGCTGADDETVSARICAEIDRLATERFDLYKRVERLQGEANQTEKWKGLYEATISLEKRAKP